MTAEGAEESRSCAREEDGRKKAKGHRGRAMDDRQARRAEEDH